MPDVASAWLLRLPARWGDLSGLPHKLESLDLPDQLFGIPAHLGRQHLHRADGKIGVNYKASPDIDSGCLIVHAIDRADLAPGIREHRERDAAFHHLGQLMLLPYLVIEAAVSAHCQYFCVQRLELTITGGDRRQLSRSDEGEVPWIEAENDPSAFIIREFDRLETYAFQISICLKVRGFFANTC